MQYDEIKTADAIPVTAELLLNCFSFLNFLKIGKEKDPMIGNEKGWLCGLLSCYVRKGWVAGTFSIWDIDHMGW